MMEKDKLKMKAVKLTTPKLKKRLRRTDFFSVILAKSMTPSDPVNSSGDLSWLTPKSSITK